MVVFQVEDAVMGAGVLTPEAHRSGNVATVELVEVDTRGAKPQDRSWRDDACPSRPSQAWVEPVSKASQIYWPGKFWTQQLQRRSCQSLPLSQRM